MCGRAYQTYTEEELAFQYLNRRPLHLKGFRASYNLAPTQQSPIVLVRVAETAPAPLAPASLISLASEPPGALPLVEAGPSCSPTAAAESATSQASDDATWILV